MWPASALLTGNGVAFVLRVPGTQHGDWWSTARLVDLRRDGRGLAALEVRDHASAARTSSTRRTSGSSLCFLVLGRGRAEPLDFWWGPMSPWLALALAIIVVGGLAILIRLRLLVIAVALLGDLRRRASRVLAGRGHAITARWHLGPVTGHYFWWVLVTSPEVLVFLFFMITDPKTTPQGDARSRRLRASRSACSARC